jgi:hypothetical protein
MIYSRQIDASLAITQTQQVIVLIRNPSENWGTEMQKPSLGHPIFYLNRAKSQDSGCQRKRLLALEEKIRGNDPCPHPPLPILQKARKGEGE